MSVTAVNDQANVFQKYLIPSRSRRVRYCMQQASIFARHSNVFYAHGASVSCVLAAIALSFFNMISYFLQIPFKLAGKIVQFQPLRAGMCLIEGLFNTMRSFVFVAMGLTFIVTGLFMPKAIFTHFAPEYSDTLEERLQQENTRLNKKIVVLEEESKKLEEATMIIQDLQRENEDLNVAKQKRWRFGF